MKKKVEGDHFTSYLLFDVKRENCVCLQIEVKTCLVFLQEAPWDGIKWDVPSVEAVQGRFKQVIRSGWGNGAIWLYHETKGVADVWCDVMIKYVDYADRDDADLVVEVWWEDVGAHCLARTKPLFGTNPYDMRVAKKHVMAKERKTGFAVDRKTQYEFYQDVVQHEFGHYLGCEHFCEWAPGKKNSIEKYCDYRAYVEQDHIMAAGDKWHGNYSHLGALHVGKPFVDCLKTHDYVDSRITPYVAKGHTDTGGGARGTPPWW
jgi:hypothetical protein